MTALHVHTFGPADAPPLLAVHGITGHGARWRRLVAEHLSGFRVLAPDLRGHGESVTQPPWTLEQHAADLLEVLDDGDISTIAVVGHSFGGPVGLHLAHLAPQRVSRLVLLDPAVGVGPDRALDIARSAHRQYPDKAAIERQQRDEWPFADDELIAEELAANVVDGGAGVRYRFEPSAVATACSEMCRTPVLPPPELSTLVVKAKQDDYVSPEFVSACKFTLGDRFAYTELDCGHMLYFERPAETGGLIRSFLAR